MNSFTALAFLRRSVFYYQCVLERLDDGWFDFDFCVDDQRDVVRSLFYWSMSQPSLRSQLFTAIADTRQEIDELCDEAIRAITG